MASKRGFGKVRNNKLADMSLPPEERGRKLRQRHFGGTPPAQMDHAQNPKARKRRREGEKAMRRSR